MINNNRFSGVATPIYGSADLKILANKMFKVIMSSVVTLPPNKYSLRGK